FSRHYASEKLIFAITPAPKGRPVVNHWPKKRPNKYTNLHVDYRLKKNVIDTYDKHGMAKTLDMHFPQLQPKDRETSRKKIYAWLRQRNHIEEKANNPHTANTKGSRRVGQGTTLPPLQEENLARWVLSMRRDGVPVTEKMLQFMALEAAIDVGLSEDEFRAGWSWSKGFKKRHGLAMRSRTRVGQDSNQDGFEALERFSRRVKDLMLEHNTDTVFNADQTGVNYEYLPTKTIHNKADKTVWIKCAGKTKDRATVMLLADSSGRKYPLFVVLKSTKSRSKEMVQSNLTEWNGFGRQVWKEVSLLNRKFGCVFHGNPTAWWNESLSMDFLRFHFENRPDRETRKVLLLWDDFSAHFTEKVMNLADELNVILEKVPPRFTWICQPADVAWIKPLKSMLRQNWLDEIKRQVKLHRARGSTFKLVGPNRSTMTHWIFNAWSSLPSSTIVNAFAKCKLIDRPSDEESLPDPFVDDDTLAILMENCAVDDTIDPSNDIEVDE
ncbi:hypothetical protein AeNC1_003357, partial [Aphanomyces euteiches]